ncbi:MAG: TAXI family TRAP transporter solute-binding subunit [Bryobacteraceae bacterium]
MTRLRTAIVSLIVLVAVAGGQTTGIKVKRPVLGGACKICPWGALGEIVVKMMQPYGYDVQMCYNCNLADAPRIVGDARTPPPYKPDPVVPEILAPRNAPGLGVVDFGVTSTQNVWFAYRGIGPYAGEKPRTNLRLIANIQSPNYLLVAAKKETGITDLAEMRKKRWPVKILARGAGGGMEETILAHYGLSVKSILDAGGSVGNTPALRKDFDVVIHNGGNMTTAPEWTVLTDVAQNFDLTFLQLPEELLAKLAKENEQQIVAIPLGLYRGVDRPIRTVARTGHSVYGRDDMPDDFAYAVAKAMDEHQDLLQWSHLNFSYNVHTVWKAFGVPLHPGAARYYKERGYMK